MDLPRVTFILGPESESKSNLVSRLLAETIDCLPVSMNQALEDATRGLFFQGIYPAPTKPMSLADATLDGRIVDMQLFFRDLEAFLRSHFGPHALGHFCLHALLNSGEFDLYQSILIPDVIDPNDLYPFQRKMKESELLIIHMKINSDPLHIVKSSSRHIWLATDDTTQQLAQIARELNPFRETHETSDAGNHTEEANS